MLDHRGCHRERLQHVLRGIKKCQHHTPQRRQPITAAILRKLVSLLRVGVFGAYRDLIMEAALVLGWFGCLRCGEFTAYTSEYDASVHIAIKDVQEKYDTVIRKRFIEVLLKASKTDPFHKGVLIKLFETGHLLCPYTVLSKLLTIRKSSCRNFNEPFFFLPDSSLLTRHVFVDNLRTLLGLIGENTGYMFAGHSLRRGLATSASVAKIPDHLISSMGRWNSDCYKSYIEVPNNAIASAQSTLADPMLCA